MKRTQSTALIIALVFATQVIAQISPEAKSVIDKFVEATGGYESKNRVESIVYTGTYGMPMQGIEASITLYMKRPSKMAMTLEIPHIGQIRSGFDGEQGWELNPVTGFRLIEGSELEQLAKQSSLFPEIEIEKHYQTAERLEDDKDGKIILNMVAHNEMSETWVIDPETHFLISTRMMIDAGVQGSFPVNIEMMDYTEVDGIKLPFLTTTSNPAFSVEIMVDTVKFNAEIGDEIFQVPAIPQS